MSTVAATSATTISAAWIWITLRSATRDFDIGYAVPFERPGNAQHSALVPRRRDDLYADRQLTRGAQRDHDDWQPDEREWLRIDAEIGSGRHQGAIDLDRVLTDHTLTVAMTAGDIP